MNNLNRIKAIELEKEKKDLSVPVKPSTLFNSEKNWNKWQNYGVDKDKIEEDFLEH